MSLFRSLLTVPVLRRQAAVTVGFLGVALALMHLSVPGVNRSVVQRCVDGELGGVAAVANFFGGGALSKVAFGAVGVMPVITAVIVLMLLGRISSRVAGLGAGGSTRFRAVAGGLGGALVLIQVVATVAAARTPGGLLPGCSASVIDRDAQTALLVGSMLLVGTGLMLGCAWGISRWGLGSGLSLLIALGVLVVVPSEVAHVASSRGALVAAGAVAALAVLAAGVAWMSRATAPMTARFDGRGGRRELALPMPFNPAGVMPLILASTLAAGPMVVASFFPQVGFLAALSGWVSDPTAWTHIVLVAVLAVAFTFYWVIVTWDAETMAAQLARRKVTVTHGEGPDASAGVEAVAARVDGFLLRVTVRAAAVLAVMAVLPSLAVALLGTSRFPLGGATLLVIVAIALDTLARIREAAAAVAPEESGAGVGAAADVDSPEYAQALVSLGKVSPFGPSLLS